MKNRFFLLEPLSPSVLLSALTEHNKTVHYRAREKSVNGAAVNLFKLPMLPRLYRNESRQGLFYSLAKTDQ